MSASPESLLQRTPLARLCGVAAAASTTALVAAGMLAAFQHSSPTTWLKPTPELMQLTKACEQTRDRAEQMHCVQAVVTAQRERTNGEIQVAAQRSVGAATSR